MEEIYEGVTYLWCSRVSGSPGNERDGQGCGLLGLTGRIAGNKREQQVPLCQDELGAVECDQQANASRRSWFIMIDDCRTDDGRAIISHYQIEFGGDKEGMTV